MTNIPAGTKFHGVAASVDTRDKKSASRNALHEAFSIEDIQLSSNNFDFTDTLSYVTEEDYESGYGFEFLTDLGGYVDLDVSGSFIGNRTVNSEGDIVTFGNVDGTAELVGTGLSFPVQGTGMLMEVGSGDYTGSFIRHANVISDLTGIGGGLGRNISLIGSFVDSVSGDKTQMGYELGVENSVYYNVAQKTNDAGETIDLELNDSETGFKISNDLSDNTASVLRVEDNNGDVRLEVKNDGVTLSDLTIDFTDTLSYITEEDYEIPFGKTYIPVVGWQNVNLVSDFIGSAIVESDYSIFNHSLDGNAQIPSIGSSFPTQGSGQILAVNNGDLSGSSLVSILGYINATSLGGGEQFLDQRILTYSDPVSGDVSWFGLQNIFDTNGASSVWVKRNNAGEQVELKLEDSQEGFKISNDLSDNTASVLRIEDNNGDAILEFFNDYLVSETIPALDYADDAAAALGGVPVGGIYHNSGTIRIRLT